MIDLHSRYRICGKFGRRLAGAWKVVAMNARIWNRFAVLILPMISFCLPLSVAQTPGGERTDLVIVGGGIAGLSAAWEAGRRGLNVVVLDMFSVFGGHAVMSEGGLCIVDTPLQRKQQVADSPALAKRDFLEWGVDADPAWVDLYAHQSSEQIFDWLRGLGVRFDGLRKQAGNRVARFHTNPERGLGVVAPIYKDCLRFPNIRFQWNTQAVSLLREGNRVSGVKGRNARTGKETNFEAAAVVLATGGYQSSLALVKQSWPEGLVFPENLLLGSGINAVGSGLELAREAGGIATRLDHQWNYPWGMVDPRFPGSRRGLNARIVNSIWVNAKGKRFVNEVLNARDALDVLLHQDPPMYWAIFDDEGKHTMSVAGTDWVQFARIDNVLLRNPDVTVKADSIGALAKAIGIAPQTLEATISGYNRMADAGIDPDFHRFGPGMPEATRINDRMAAPPKRIEHGPFYAIRMGPLTRKSMGGLAIDLDCRVLNADGDVIDGLYAVGEVTGFGGINGSAGLEGTFLGPSMFQGRIAGRKIATGREPVTPGARPEATAGSGTPAPKAADGAACLACHAIPKLLATERPGFRHFELVHGVVTERALPCLACHAEMSPFRTSAHKIDRTAQVRTCATCHMGRE